MRRYLSLLFLIGVGPAWNLGAQESPPPAGPASGPGAEPEEAPVLKLPEVVVTATRSAAETWRLPYGSYTLSEERLRVQQSPRSLPEALEETPGVSVQKTGSGLESPYLRGFTGFRTLLLIDGIRLNNAVFREGPNQYWGTVDPLAISRIETVLGPSSVLYGSDAIGGTVNALTLEEFPRGLHPGATYRYASAERSHTARAEVRGLQGPVGYTGGITWRDFGDLIGGRHIGEQENTDFRALSGDAKVSWQVTPQLRLTAAQQSFDQDDVPRTHITRDGISFHGTTIGTDRKRDFDQERYLTYGRAEWIPKAEWLESVSLTLSHHLQKEVEDRIRSNFRRTRQGFDDHAIGIQLAAITPSPLGRWTYGAEYTFDTVDSFRKDYSASGALSSVSPRGPVADEAQYGLLGAFIQDDYAPWEWVEVVAGGRYNFSHVKAAGDDIDPDLSDSQAFANLDENFEALVGSGRVIFHPLPWLSPYAGVSQGFRAPNLSDLTRFDVARSGEVEIPATDLDPERFVSFEGGLHFHGASWHATASYFYTDVEDMIVRSFTGQTIDGLPAVSRDNVGDGYIQGVELGSDWEFFRNASTGDFGVFSNFSWIEGKVKSFHDNGALDLNPIDKNPPTQFLFGLRWQSPKSDGWVEVTYRVVLEQDHLSPGDQNDTQRIPPGGTPGYELIGLRGGWRIFERFNLFAGVENLADRDYRVHGSGVNGPGTNFVGGVDYRW